MNPEKKWTSTGIKLIHHPKVIEALQRNRAFPISLQIATTSKCQLNCSFCSNVNRKKKEELDYNLLLRTIFDMNRFGAKTVEWTGGGEPLLYSKINEVILVVNTYGMEQGLITNGLELDKLESKKLDMLKWIRISMNCLDYVDNIAVPKLSNKTTLGFSYVINNNTTEEGLRKLSDYVKRHKPKYVRIVPNCQTTKEEQEKNNKFYSKKIRKIGYPYFYQAKIFEKPDKCYWGYLKPFIHYDGNVFRCSSVVLNDDAEKSFHNKYRWCHISELKNVYNRQIVPYIPEHCDKCVFTNQNNLVDSIINPNSMVNFI